MHLSRPDLPRPEPELPALPDRVFLAPSHRDLAVALSRGLAQPGSVIAVTGEAGLGKTTLVNAVVAALAGRAGPVRQAGGMDGRAPAALRPLLDRVPADDLLPCSMSFAGAGNPAVKPGALDVLILDDAHELSPGFLRGLSAVLSGSGLDSLLPRVVLVGRPGFWPRLDDPSLLFLRDRIDLRIPLQPMPYPEAEGFVEHLFRLAGGSARSLLSAEALRGLLVRSQGNPRRIIAELEKALALEADDRHRPAVDQPAGAVLGSREPASQRRRRPARRWVALASGVAGIAAALAGAVALLPMAAPVRELWAAHVVPAPEVPAAPRPGALVTPSSGEDKASAEEPDRPAAGSPEAVERASAEAPPREEAAPTPVQTNAPAAPPTEAEATPEGRPADAGTEAAVPPVPPSAVSAPPDRPARQELPREVVAVLVRRGKAMLELRDVSAARRLFERAALAGSAEAAAALGRTYDPGLQPGAAWEVDTDRNAAITWYRLAASLGDADARLRLDLLGKEAGP